MSADSIATSVPEPIAMPRSAWASAAASLTPSPTIATTRPSRCSAATTRCLSCGQHVGEHVRRVDADLARRPPRAARALSPVSRYGVEAQRRAARAMAARESPHRVGDGRARPARRAVPADEDRACRRWPSAAEQLGRRRSSNRDGLADGDLGVLDRGPARPRPGLVAKPRTRGSSSRASRAPATTARASGCSLPASTAAAGRSAAVSARRPAATSTQAQPAGGDRAGLVEHDGVDPAGALEHLRALDEDAELGAAAGADQQRGRRGQAERAGAGDDEHGHRGGEAPSSTSWPVSSQATKVSEREDEDDGHEDRRRPGRRAAGRRPCRSGPARRGGHRGERRVGADPAGLDDEAAGGVERAAGDVVAGADVDGHGLAGDEAARRRPCGPRRTTPSVATFSPGRTTKWSPTTSSSTGTRSSLVTPVAGRSATATSLAPSSSSDAQRGACPRCWPGPRAKRPASRNVVTTAATSK